MIKIILGSFVLATSIFAVDLQTMGLKLNLKIQKMNKNSSYKKRKKRRM